LEQIGLEALFDMSMFDKGMSNYISKVKEAEDTTGKAAGGMGKAFDTIGKKVADASALIGKTLVAATVAAGAAVGAFVVGGIKGAMDLESQMGGIAAMMGLTKDEVGPLKDLIMDLGLDPTLKVNATEAADAIEKLGSNGLSMAQIMDGAAKSTVLLANSTGADFDTAAAVASDTMALFNIKAEDMMTAVDGITGVTVASKFGINDYRLALSQAGGVASAAGVEFGDFNTTITGISSYFASGSDAGTSFKTMLLRLVPTTSNAAEAMNSLDLTSNNAGKAMEYLRSRGIEPVSGSTADLIQQTHEAFLAQYNLTAGTDEAIEKFGKWALETGVVQSAFYDTNGQLRSMDEISVILNKSLEGLSEMEKTTALNAIFGTDAMRAAVGVAGMGEIAYTDQALAAKELGVSFDSLTGAMEGGLTKYEALNAQIGNTDAAESAKLRMDNFKGSLEILQGVFDTIAIKIGFLFLPILKTMTDRLAALADQYAPDIIAFFDNFAQGLEKLISGAGWREVFPEWVATVVDTLTKNSDLLLGALGGIAALLATAGIAAAFSAIGAAIATILSPIGLLVLGSMALGAAWNTNFLGMRDKTIEAFDAIKAAIEPLTTALSTFGTGALTEIIAFVTGNTTEFTNLKAIWDGLTETVSGVLTSIVGAITAAIPGWTASILALGATIGTSILSFDYVALGTGIIDAIKAGWTAAVTLFEPIITALGTSISTLLKAVDWLEVGTSILTAIGAGWSAAAETVSTIVTALGTTISTTLKAVDWLTLGTEIVNFIMAGWGLAVAAFTTAVTALGTSIGITLREVDWQTLGSDILTAIGLGWAFAVTTVGETIKAFGTSVGTWLRAVDWKTLGGDILAAIGLGWAFAVTTVGETIKAFGTSIGTWLRAVDWLTLGTDILNAIGDGWSAAVTLFAPTITAWGTDIGTTLRAVDWLQLGTDIITGIQDGWTAAKEAATTALGLIATSFKDQFGDTVAGWTVAGKGILTNIQSGIESAKAAMLVAVTATVTGIKDKYATPEGFAWKTLGEDISNAVKDGLKAAADIAGGLLTVALSIANSIKSSFTDLSWSEIGTLIITAIKDSLRAAADLVNGLLKVAADIGADIGKKFTEIDWLAVGHTIASGIKDGFKALVSAVGGLIPSATDAGTSVADAFSDIDWNASGQAIIDGVIAGIKFIAYGALGTAYVVGQIAIGMLEEFTGIAWKDTGTAIITAIQLGIITMSESIKLTVSTLATDILAYFTAIDWLGTGGKLVTDFKQGITDAKAAFLLYIGTFASDILKKFTDIEWIKIGTGIIDGIKKGITDSKDKLTGYVTSFLKDILPDFAEQALGIQSPSKVFAVMGVAIVEGLIVGMQSMIPKLQTAIQSITFDLTKDLVDMDFSASTAFADRVEETYITPLLQLVNNLNDRKKEVQATIDGLAREIEMPGTTPARTEEIVNLIARFRQELEILNRTAVPQQLTDLQALLSRNTNAQNSISFLEDQIELVKQAKALGVDVSGIGIGDTSQENVLRMLNIETRIAELKRSQLVLSLQQLKAETERINQFQGLQDAITHVDKYNSFLNEQLSLMKRAESLGLNLQQLWSGGIIQDPNDMQQILSLQLRIASASGAALRTQMQDMIAEQKRVTGLESALRSLQPWIDQTNVSSAFGQRYKATVLDPILRALEEAAGIDSERVRLMNEYRIAAEKLAAIGRKEEQLDFLKQQLDIVSMIRDQDIPGGDSIFAGLTFGLNASIDDLLAITSRTLDGLIKQVKDGLGIHSPSEVFADIGQQMMAGLGKGIQEGIMKPLSSLRQGTRAHGAMSTRTLNFAMGGVNIYTPMDEIMFENRVLRILERAM